MSLEIILIVIAVEFLVLAAFAVPFLSQILRTARNMSVTLEAVNQRLPAIMKNLEEITANVDRAAYTVNRQVEDLARTVGNVKQMLGIGENGDCLWTGGGYLFRALRTVNAVLKGAHVFFDVFRSRR